MTDGDSDRELERLIETAALRASDALSGLLNAEIRVDHSQLYNASWRQPLSERLRGREDTVTLSQTAFGGEPMRVSLIVEGRHLRRLLDMLMGRPGASRRPAPGDREIAGARVDPTEIDALKETANIVAGACVGVLARELSLSALSLPSLLAQSTPEERVRWLLPAGQSLCSESCLKARHRPLQMELMMSILRGSAAGLAAEHTNGGSVPAAALPGGRHSAAGQARN